MQPALARPLTAALLLLLAAAAFAAVPTGPMTFTTLDQGDNSGIEEPRTAVVRTAEEWAALWKAHAPARPAPRVDLGSAIVLAVFAGTRPSAGHAVEILRLEVRGPGLVVCYRERAPRPDEMVAQMLTTPFHIVATGRQDSPVTFERVKE